MNEIISPNTLILVLAVQSASGAVFTVTNTDDTGPGSLRQAILEANKIRESEANKIEFNIPGPGPHTIVPASGLPPITAPVIIDGTTQPGFAGRPIIELNGSVAGSTKGLHITAGNSTVRGLAINRFGGSNPGVRTAQIQLETRGGNRIEGNFLGPDLTGTRNVGTPEVGLRLRDSSNNVIGGTNAASRNVMSGGGRVGLELVASFTYSPMTDRHSMTSGSSKNEVIGNFIGVDVTGTKALPNAWGGIYLMAKNNIIGGTNAAARNIISGNTGSGVIITCPGSVIQGNYIGTDVTGTVALGNGLDGIALQGLVVEATNNVIGGSAKGAGNVISGNKRHGVRFQPKNTLRNTVQGNFIGTDASGQIALGNGESGVSILESDRMLIGGSNSGEGNTIAFNGAFGVSIEGGDGNAIRGSRIFSNAAGAITSANGLPVLYALKATAGAAGGMSIEGMVTSWANAALTLDFFWSSACVPTAQGQNYLGSTTANTDVAGQGKFSAVFSANVPPGAFLTATATDAENNTSQFSDCIEMTLGVAAPNPSITWAVSGNALSLSWPASAKGFVLESTAGLSPPIRWSAVTAVPTLTGEQNQVRVVIPGEGTRFYRIWKP